MKSRGKEPVPILAPCEDLETILGQSKKETRHEVAVLVVIVIVIRESNCASIFEPWVGRGHACLQLRVERLRGQTHIFV
jgi:hypothetical protein